MTTIISLLSLRNAFTAASCVVYFPWS